MKTKQMNVPFEIKEFTESDDHKFYFIKGYGSVFNNVDLGGDIVLNGAFEESLKKRMPKFVYQHKITEPIGVWDKAFEDENGLYLSGRMPKENSRVKDIATLINMGAFGGLSIGYSVKDFEREGENLKLKKLDLWEVSLVTLPMNPQARIADFKGATTFQDLPLADRGRAWDSNRAIARVRDFTDSNGEPSNTYRKAFFWYDGEDAENFTAYKLPYADVIDGALKAVPRAIFAVAAALSGARGGVDIPEEDAQKVKNHVNRYYAKMRRQFNDEAIISPFEKQFTQVNSVREFEEYLKNCGFSKSEQRDIIAKAKQGLTPELTKSIEEEITNRQKAEKEKETEKQICDGILDITNKINKHLSK